MIIREAIRDDLLSVARVQVESSRSAYRGIMPDSYLDNMSYEIKAREWDERLFGGGSTEFMYVAETDNAGIVGYASASKTRINEIYERELISLYILKEFQRNGIGKQLFEAVISEFSKCKVSSMILWTLEENPSRYFYEFMGGRIFGNRIIERGGKKLRQIGYVWDDIAGIVRKMQRR